MNLVSVFFQRIYQTFFWILFLGFFKVSLHVILADLLDAIFVFFD